MTLIESTKKEEEEKKNSMFIDYLTFNYLDSRFFMKGKVSADNAYSPERLRDSCRAQISSG